MTEGPTDRKHLNSDWTRMCHFKKRPLNCLLLKKRKCHKTTQSITITGWSCYGLWLLIANETTHTVALIECGFSCLNKNCCHPVPYTWYYNITWTPGPFLLETKELVWSSTELYTFYVSKGKYCTFYFPIFIWHLYLTVKSVLYYPLCKIFIK